MLHHLTLWVPDLDRAKESWSWLLVELGYVAAPPVNGVVLFRLDSGFAIALERSPDMVTGMLHSRFRPGVNHIAFSVASASALAGIENEAGSHGWSPLPSDRHPIAGGADVLYLEDRDGFEVELVGPRLAGPASPV